MNQIISIQIDLGKTHDLTIARKHAKELACLRAIGDLAYKGFKEISNKLLIPIKKLKKKELPPEAKLINNEISRRRIPIEHLNTRLKVFPILSK